MHRRTTRANRVGFVVLGLVLLAAGGYVIVRNRNLIGGQPAADHLYTQADSHWLGHHQWIWFSVAAVAIGVALLALRWIWVQPRIDRVRRLYIEPEPDQEGRTIMACDVLTDAVEDDVVEYPGVARARGLIIGTTDRPELVLRVSANLAADLDDIRDRIATHALPAVRAALDSDTMPAQVHLVVVGRTTGRPS